MSDKTETSHAPEGSATLEEQADTKRDLPPAARRALAEAAERRAHMEAEEAARPRELGGRGGKDPARYGDWEVKGVAVDF